MAPPSAPRAPTMLWALFGLDGRISREVFWLGLFFIEFLAGALMFRIDPVTGLIMPTPLSPILFVPVVWVHVALAAKRLHDRGISAWFSLFIFVPFAFVVIGLIPGDRGPNLYGRATNARGA